MEIEHKFNTRGYSCIVFTIAQVGGLGELVFFFFPQNSQGKQISTFLRKQTKKSQPFFFWQKRVQEKLTLERKPLVRGAFEKQPFLKPKDNQLHLLF